MDFGDGNSSAKTEIGAASLPNSLEREDISFDQEMAPPHLQGLSIQSWKEVAARDRNHNRSQGL